MGKVRQADGFIIINENSGEIILGKSPKEFTGGLFEGRIATSDISDIQSHISTSKIKAIFCIIILYAYLNRRRNNISSQIRRNKICRRSNKICHIDNWPINLLMSFLK